MTEPNAKVAVDRTSYGPGHIVYITIIDRNFNLSDDVIESIDLTQIVKGDPILEVRITQPTKGKLVLSAVDGSLKDDSGKPVVEAVESGPNTSSFELFIKLPDDLEPDSSVSVIYNDPFELSPTSRETVPVKGNVRLIETRITEANGQPLTDIDVGEKVVFRSTIQSSLNGKQEYSYIVQIKDHSGYTIALSWISGIVGAKSSTAVSIAWIPEGAGQYTAEIFLWESVTKPLPLTLRVEHSVLDVE
jgi:hypothetical protein